MLAPPLVPAGGIRENLIAHHDVALLADRAPWRDGDAVHCIELGVPAGLGEDRAKRPAGPRGEV